MNQGVVRLDEKLAMVTECWTPKIVAELNDYHVKVVKVDGDFIWHSHPETDELFLVLSGQLRIELRDGHVQLGPGDLYVVARGVEHRPVSDGPCSLLLVEPGGTPNTGDMGGDLTAPSDDWI